MPPSTTRLMISFRDPLILVLARKSSAFPRPLQTWRVPAVRHELILYGEVIFAIISQENQFPRLDPSRNTTALRTA